MSGNGSEAGSHGSDGSDVAALRQRLEESEEALRAIRHGEVDALVVAAVAGHERVFTLSSADGAYRTFVENMSDGAATVSADGIVLYANQALADLVATTCEQLVGNPVVDFVTPSSRGRIEEIVVHSSPRGSFEATLLTTGGDNVPVRVASSSAVNINADVVTCITITDLTSERRAEEVLEHSAQHDSLTGLPNRTLLTDRITHALNRRVSNGKAFIALLFCDVDGFKNINDAYGHQVGDDMLRTVASRLSAAVRPEDTVARIGGDEFVILCEGLSDVTDAAMVAARARSAVGAPITSGSTELDITVSIGVAVASVDDDASPDTLLRDADEAMYKAKRQGPNVIELFDEQLRNVATSRLRLLSEMRHAVGDSQLRLFYQPVMGLHDESPVGVEALVRWQHPARGLVMPDQFIPFAEHSGLINGIGDWVLHKACQQTASWTAAIARPLQMSVNVSGRQLVHGAGLVQSVQAAIVESGSEPAALTLEVTESALMVDAEAALRVVNELKELGVRIAIDDFGIGYSSLVYLKRFPVDLLKVDRSFVAGLGHQKDDTAIVRSVIELAHAFGIDAVAEGIETREQLQILQDMGCGFGQGYLWSRPVPAVDLDPLLATGPTDSDRVGTG